MLCVVCTLAEFLNADQDRYGDSRENTRAAIDELNDVLRMLFPIVPHKSHLLLRQTNHIRRVGNFLSTTPRHFETSIQSIDQLATAENLPNLEDVKGSDHAQEKEEKSEHLFANPSPPLIPIESRMAVGPTSQGHRQGLSNEHPFWFRQAKPTSSLQALLLAREQADSPKGANAAQVHQRMHSAGGAQQSAHQPHVPSLKEHYFHGLAGAHLGTGHAPSKLLELTTPALGKRGPECMRRCIMQRLLHPVQCHSLC